jgi:hypothetical protein
MSIKFEESVDAGSAGNGRSAVGSDEKPPADPTRALATIVPTTIVASPARAGAQSSHD